MSYARIILRPPRLTRHRGHYDLIYKPGEIYQQPPLTTFIMPRLPECNYSTVDELSTLELAALPNSCYVPDDVYYQHRPHYPAHSQSTRHHHHEQHFSSAYYTDSTFTPVDTFAPTQLTHETSPHVSRPQQQDYFAQPQEQYRTTLSPSSMPISPTSGPQNPHSSAVPTSPNGQPSSPNSDLQIRFTDQMYSRPRQRSIPVDPNTSAR